MPDTPQGQYRGRHTFQEGGGRWRGQDKFREGGGRWRDPANFQEGGGRWKNPKWGPNGWARGGQTPTPTPTPIPDNLTGAAGRTGTPTGAPPNPPLDLEGLFGPPASRDPFQISTGPHPVGPAQRPGGYGDPSGAFIFQLLSSLFGR